MFPHSLYSEGGKEKEEGLKKNTMLDVTLYLVPEDMPLLHAYRCTLSPFLRELPSICTRTFSTIAPFRPASWSRDLPATFPALDVIGGALESYFYFLLFFTLPLRLFFSFSSYTTAHRIGTALPGLSLPSLCILHFLVHTRLARVASIDRHTHVRSVSWKIQKL